MTVLMPTFTDIVSMVIDGFSDDPGISAISLVVFPFFTKSATRISCGVRSKQACDILLRKGEMIFSFVLREPPDSHLVTGQRTFFEFFDVRKERSFHIREYIAFYFLFCLPPFV